jgi:hypothetical protein
MDQTTKEAAQQQDYKRLRGGKLPSATRVRLDSSQDAPEMVGFHGRDAAARV